MEEIANFGSKIQISLGFNSNIFTTDWYISGWFITRMWACLKIVQLNLITQIKHGRFYNYKIEPFVLYIQTPTFTTETIGPLAPIEGSPHWVTKNDQKSFYRLYFPLTEYSQYDTKYLKICTVWTKTVISKWGSNIILNLCSQHITYCYLKLIVRTFY